MQRNSWGRATAFSVGLLAASAIGAMLLPIEWGKASVQDRPDGSRREKRGVAEARALVAALEARLRADEANLKQARELLAMVENIDQPAPAARPAVNEGPAEVDMRLEGVWRIVSIGGNFGGQFRKPPYDEYKIMTAGRYLWLSFEPNTGKVLRSGGGTYTLKGETYMALVDYSNSDDLRAVVGREYTGTCKLDGKQWYHFGRMPNGAVFDELWERMH